MHRFYAPPQSFVSKKIFLEEEETKHLRSVLRLCKGSIVRVFDGKGREFLCRIEKIDRKYSEALILQECEPKSPESSFDLHLAVSLIKGEKFDVVIQKAVELGVKSLTPLITKRSEVKPSERRQKRWQNIVIQASKQSGRAKLMEIHAVSSFRDFIEKSSSKLILFSERDGKSFSEVPYFSELTAIIGPEGGWDDEELRLARNKGVLVVSLGGRTLRAETASIVAATILQHRFGDLR
ncbi:MAG: 16S rRNA (uracil(1498)-N(3))-methyltransferase [Pyrinomonadaceae bacterium]|nr:16S rRNA (uracil(1498)-N(3))-methyltransferase [Pyrinomonadaceae bacterium]